MPDPSGPPHVPTAGPTADLRPPAPPSAAASGRARQRERAARRDATSDLLDRAHDAPPGSRRDDLLNQVVVVNRGVADAVASHFRDRGVAQEDLQQTAYEALLKAVRRFDPERSDDLLTFAVPTIRGELQRHLRDLGWMVRPPRRLQRLRADLGACREDLVHELGREPETAEIAARLGVTAAEVEECRRVPGCLRPTSLDQEVHDGSEVSLGDLIPDDAAGATGEDRVLLAQLLATLGDRERLILRMRFDQDLTQAEIGRRIGVTQMQVSRLITGILGRLRAAADA